MSGGQSSPVVFGRFANAAPAVADGETAPLRINNAGVLLVATAAAAPIVTIEATPTRYSSGGDTQGGLIGAAGARLLREIQSFNTTGATRYLQLHDAAALPPNGTVPIWVVTVATLTEINKVWNPKLPFTVGAFWVSSTTRATLTAGGAADMFTTALYDT